MPWIIFGSLNSKLLISNYKGKSSQFSLVHLLTVCFYDNYSSGPFHGNCMWKQKNVSCKPSQFEKKIEMYATNKCHKSRHHTWVG